MIRRKVYEHIVKILKNNAERTWSPKEMRELLETEGFRVSLRRVEKHLNRSALDFQSKIVWDGLMRPTFQSL